jgi:hypothetical protein
MNQASQNKATSAQDVQSQNLGQDTAAGQAANGLDADDGNTEAAAALTRAQQFQQAGDEASCMNEIGKAQEALQIQP